MRSAYDALRSLQRYFALAMPGYEVRLEDQIEHAPMCIITRTTPVTGEMQSAMFTDYSFGARAAAYPGPQPSYELAVHAAGQIEAVLLTVLRRGVGAGAPARIPLYDYALVGPDEPAVDGAQRVGQDFLRVSNITSDTLPDPEDMRLRTVVLSFTVGWRAVGVLHDPQVTPWPDPLPASPPGDWTTVPPPPVPPEPPLPPQPKVVEDVFIERDPDSDTGGS
jgi:hypothetical protein